VAYHLVRGATRVLIYERGRADGRTLGIEYLYQPLTVWLEEGLVAVCTSISTAACASNGDVVE
jgi:hypothetical protein